MTIGQQLHVSVETELDPALAETFHSLYREAFGALEARAVARQLLHREEFLEEMHDPRVEKHVAWSEGVPIGLSTLTRHLETVPWISPAYFAHHYPEAFARGAVYYIGFALVQAEHRQARVFQALVHSMGLGLAEARAVVGWDICAFNDESFAFGEHAARALEQTGDVTVVPVDRQTYYVGTFGDPA
ncbi:hypothetical protein [Nocardioides pyridinolyticus]